MSDHDRTTAYGSFSSLIQAVEQNGGWVNHEVFGIQSFGGMGYGAIALADVKPDQPLFRIPLNYLLTPFTSQLRSHLTLAEWESLGEGWARLILVMMWEESRGADSPWAAYLASLPTEFTTPMFWSDTSPLNGTDIQDRIGKEDAEKDFHERIEPLVKARPDVFSPSSCFSLDSYHIQGSRILSRSFTIPVEDAGDSDSEEDAGIAVMVPIADILNAAYEQDNARLHEDSGYSMIAVKSIPKGAQILNTYGHPPNSELLRKYGHVDVLPLPEEHLAALEEEEIGDWPFGNAGDEVMVSGDRVLKIIGTEGLGDRIDWWLEEGEEDSFVASFHEPLDEDFVSFVRLLMFDDEWQRAKKKGRAPRPTLDAEVSDVLRRVIDARLSAYGQTLEDDLQLIRKSEPGSNEYNAAVVRIGEKRVLAVARRAASGTSGASTKRFRV